MKRVFLIALLAIAANAQVVSPGFWNFVTSAPSGSCSQNNPPRYVMGPGTVYTCQSGAWTQLGAGSTGVTSVSGTTNQIDVATGTTTPVISFDANFASGGLSFFGSGSTTSAQLLALLTNATGTGAAVFGTSPTLVSPALGTPSAINLSNATALPIAALPATVGIFMGGCLSNTPTGTQYCPPVARTTVATAENGQAFVLPRAITASAMYVNLINAEGAAATLQFTLATCTTTACSAVSATALTCTVANSASTCSQTGQAVAIAAGTNIVVQTIQTGTGTASVSSVSIAYQ
jgi:hypothetical protein